MERAVSLLIPAAEVFDGVFIEKIEIGSELAELGIIDTAENFFDFFFVFAHLRIVCRVMEETAAASVVNRRIGLDAGSVRSDVKNAVGVRREPVGEEQSGESGFCGDLRHLRRDSGNVGKRGGFAGSPEKFFAELASAEKVADDGFAGGQLCVENGAHGNDFETSF